MRKKLFYIILLLLISSIFTYIIFTLIDNRKKEIIENEKELVSVTYNTIIEALRVHANIIYFNKINTKYIKELFAQVDKATPSKKDEIRDKIYNELIDMYQNMSDFKLKQLHFHLKNNESFLRFHRPDKHGDNLTGIRETVAYVNKFNRPIYGFEEGKIFNGYRFVYPLNYKGKHLGSVESSISMKTIVEELQKEMHSNVDFVIKKSVVEKKLFDDEKSNYRQCETLSDYYHENSINTGANKLLETISHKYLKKSPLEAKLKQGELFSFFITIDEQDYITTFFPIKNAISLKTVGYIIVADKNHNFRSYETQYLLFLVTLIFFTTAIIYFIYRIDDEKTKLIRKDKILNEVQKIGKLGFWELDLIKNELIWSDEVYNIFELQKQEFGKSYEEFLKHIYPDDISFVNKTYEDSIKNKTNYQIEHRIITRSGKIKYVSEECHHTFDDKGNVIQSLGTIIDITNIKLYQSQIEKSKAQFESLVAHIPDIVYRCEIDEDFTILFINEAVKPITGYSLEELRLNRIISFSSIIDERDLSFVKKEIKRIIKKGIQSTKIEYRIVTKDNRIIWVNNFIKIINDEGYIYIEGVISDITIQKEAYSKLEKFIDTQDNIVILTDSKELNFANRRFFDFLGYKDLMSFKKNYNCICQLFIENDRFFHLKKIKEQDRWIEEMIKLPAAQRVVAMLGQDFSVYAFSVTINKFENNLYILSFTDISETMLEQIELEEKTIHDKLTSAYNREYFDLNYKKLLKTYNDETHTLALTILDIDFFKLVNDTFGHDAGDFVLKELVSEINKFSRNEDILIRWGGEEFIIILKVESKTGLFKALEHIRKIIEEHYFKDVKKITCSFGATLYKDKEEIEDTIKRADKALYQAKNTGRNKVVIL